MAEINLGAIKFNWKGTYAGGTAYVVDDVVYYNGSSYVCIAASTGNLPTNGTYWQVMAEGGDVATVLTTQGDILYRSGSGLARLAAGTSGQFLKTQGSGANPVWGTVTADSGFASTQVFTSSGTWTKPTGVTKIRVYVTGSGGGGGGSTSSTYGFQSGSGGGAGATAIKLIDVSSVTSVSVTIATGGVGNDAAAGSNGGTSSFGSYCSAAGGTGGVVPGAFNYGVNGGAATGGDINIHGGGSGMALESAGGAMTSSEGGSSYWGAGGGGIWSGNGGTGRLGAGGGAGSGNNAVNRGGQGGNGICYVEEYK